MKFIFLLFFRSDGLRNNDTSRQIMAAERESELTITAEEDTISCGLDISADFRSELTITRLEGTEEVGNAGCCVMTGEIDLERTFTLGKTI